MVHFSYDNFPLLKENFLKIVLKLFIILVDISNTILKKKPY